MIQNAKNTFINIFIICIAYFICALFSVGAMQPTLVDYYGEKSSEYRLIIYTVYIILNFIIFIGLALISSNDFKKIIKYSLYIICIEALISTMLYACNLVYY